MRMPYPRSFLGLLILGFGLALTPLVIGLATSAVYTDRLAVRAQSALQQAVQVTQTTRRIAAVIRELERSAKQSAILGERTASEPYRSWRKQLVGAVGQLAQAPFDPAQRARLARVLEIEAAVFAAMSDPAAAAEALEAANAGFDEANRLAEAIIDQGDALIERESRSMIAMAHQAQTIVYWQLAAALPLVILVVSGVALVLARPVRKLDRAIGAIGEGRLSQPVGVTGPRDLEQLGRRLEWLRTELLGLEQQKNRFLRHVAHDLKTPLAAVRESAHLLLERFSGPLTPTQQELAAILQRNALELQRLIEDLLLLGEAQFRRMNVDLEPVDLTAIVEQVRSNHELAVRAKNLSFELKLAAEATRFVADRDKVRVILDNLVSNAIKHSPAGSTIEIMARQEHDAVSISVHDQGPGIAPEDREKIFDPFYQGRTRGSGVVKSSGVGLSIVREYALAHGGNAQVANDERGGTQFCVRLPRSEQGTAEAS
jgi:two-component system, NtrC family, sensor histidine kinase GlrK